MPGKHAPPTPTSFYLSLARSLGGALGALILVIIVVLLVLDRGPEGGSRAAPTGTATPTVTATTTATPTQRSARPPSRTRVEVYNGTGRAGLAASVSSALEDEGYRMAAPGNAPATDRTVIYYRPGARREARELLRRHPGFRRIAASDGTFPRTGHLAVVLGSDYED